MMKLMQRRRSSALFGIVAGAIFASGAGAGGQPIVTTDLLRLRHASAIDVARSGALAVFVVHSIETIPFKDDGGHEGAQDHGEGAPIRHEPTYENRSHLFAIDLTDRELPVRQLTFGPRSDHSPEISPDGRWIAFARTEKDESAGEEKQQVWVLPTDGGEARPATSLEHGAGSPHWSPDGERLLVSSSIPFREIEGAPPWPSDRPSCAWEPNLSEEERSQRTGRPDGTREEIRQWLDANAAESNPIVIHRLNFQDELALRGEMTFEHLFLVDADDPSAPPAPVTRGFFNHADAVFMPDGQSILYASRKRTDVHPDRVIGTDLWQINIDGSNDRPRLAMEGWTAGSPQPSRDGRVIAFLGEKLDEPAFRQARLGLIAADEAASSPEPVWLTSDETFAGSVHAFEWLPTSAEILFTSPRRGAVPLMTCGPSIIEPAAMLESWDGEPAGVMAFGVGGGAVVAALTGPRHPAAILVRDAAGIRHALDLNPWLADKMISLPVESTITRPDGVEVQYWVMEPEGRKPGRKYPVVLQIHGGPSAMWGPGERTMWHEFQLLCSRGFGVVYANPRGSGGYGYEFQRKNFQDWGDGPAGDVLAALDDAAARHDWMDRDQLVVTGGSYGGYLTAWIIAHDRRFKAAVAQRGVYDLATFYGEGNAWQLVEWAFGGPPHDPRVKDVIERHSVLAHVQRIRTPLLITHGSNDLRTGVSQSEMLFRALAALGQPVEYVRYPDAGHDLSRTGDPQQRMDRLNRIIEFFQRYVGDSRPRSASSAAN